MKRKTMMTVAVLIVMLVSLFGTAAAQTGVDPTTTPTAPTTGVTPSPTAGVTAPTTDTTTGTKFFTHPVVLLLSKYFDRDTEATTPTTDDPATAETPAAVSGTPEAGATPVAGTTDGAATDEELGLIGQQIAQYHEEGMGFGVLVKIYAMAEASKTACEKAATGTSDTAGDTTGTTGDTTTGATSTCTPVTADQLVEQFKSGAGMGQLFKEYGKPNLLGVGHVKQELKKHQADGQTAPTTVSGDDQQTDDTTVDAQDNGNGNGNADKNDKSGKGKQNKGNNGQSKDKGKGKNK